MLNRLVEDGPVGTSGLILVDFCNGPNKDDLLRPCWATSPPVLEISGKNPRLEKGLV